jgi:hypothetical protein
MIPGYRARQEQQTQLGQQAAEPTDLGEQAQLPIPLK